MAYVIAESCIGVKDKACAQACPVDAIHDEEESPQMYIDPNCCICCSACEPECPIGAIFEEADLPAKWRHYAKINADFYEAITNGKE